MNAQQNIALHELIQKVRFIISKLSREYDSTLIFKHLLEDLDVLIESNCIQKDYHFLYKGYIKQT